MRDALPRPSGRPRTGYSRWLPSPRPHAINLQEKQIKSVFLYTKRVCTAMTGETDFLNFDSLRESVLFIFLSIFSTAAPLRASGCAVGCTASWPHTLVQCKAGVMGVRAASCGRRGPLHPGSSAIPFAGVLCGVHCDPICRAVPIFSGSSFSSCQKKKKPNQNAPPLRGVLVCLGLYKVGLGSRAGREAG